MPGGRTKFNPKWLESVDKNGHTLHTWCQASKVSDYEVYCIWCKKSVGCANMGVAQIIQHASSAKHISFGKAATNKSQTLLVARSSASTSKSASVVKENQSFMVTAPPLHIQTLTAEVLLALDMAHHDSSFASGNHKAELFRKMFPGPVADGMTTSSNKLAYLISDGIGPYFTSQTIEDLKKSGNMFTVHFDETTNASFTKQMDLLIRYWSESEGKVVIKFLHSITFGHATADHVANKGILETLEKFQLPLNKFLSLARDGPNVNKAAVRKIDQALTDAGLHPLVDTGPCNLHSVHNAFGKGIAVFGHQAEELAIDLYYWFKQSPCRREDFAELQRELGISQHVFLRHLNVRWLSLGPAIERILEQWNPLCQYIENLPKSDKACEKNSRYKRIRHAIQDPSVLVQIHFLVSVMPLFTEFLTLFQAEGPMIHRLHQEGSELIRKLMLRYLKRDAVGEAKGAALQGVPYKNVQKHLSSSDIDIGLSTRQAMKSVKADRQKILLLDMKAFYTVVTEYLLSHFPLDNSLLKYLSCLRPEEHSRQASDRYIKEVVKLIPCLSADTVVGNSVSDEWKLYISEDAPPSINPNTGNPDRVDTYWSKVLDRKTANGDAKYKALSKVVKLALTLPHGNADAERSFSANKKTVTHERSSLSIAKINGLRTTKEAVMRYGGAHLVPITPGLLQAARNSAKSYKDRLEAEKRMQEKEKEKSEEAAKIQKEQEKQQQELKSKGKEVHSEEKDIQSKEADLREDMQRAETLFSEANQRLADAIKERDFHKASVAQGLLDVTKQRMKSNRKELEKLGDLRRQIESKRKRIFSDYSVALKKSKTD